MWISCSRTREGGREDIDAGYPAEEGGGRGEEIHASAEFKSQKDFSV